MKRILPSLLVLATLASAANAQVWINEITANVPGGDSIATAGYEFFELRGTPNLSLSGHYLLSLEGQGTTGRGDVNQFFDLGTFSIGANGYLAGQQFGSPYAPIGGATIASNTVGQGWGVAGSGTVGHSADGAPPQLDLENSATTILLINIGSGAAPTLTLDLDPNDDGSLDLPVGWSVADSVGLMDATGTAPAATDFSYAAITFRIGTVGSSANGNIIDVPGSGTSLYVGRIGDSTGSTSADWFGSIMSGSAGNFSLSSATDPRFNGKAISEMQLGGTNPVPEPGTFVLLGFGCLALLLRRKSC